MKILENIVPENRLDKIRLLEPEHFVIGGQPSQSWENPNDNNAHYDLACTAKYTLEKIESEKNNLLQVINGNVENKIEELLKIIQNNQLESKNKDNILLESLKLAMPVGLLANSIDQKPFNHMWLNLNGESIDNDTYPVLYQYLKSIGYTPEEKEGKLVIKLPDARGLVFRSQNKGHFNVNEVEEIPLGGYQKDATQKFNGEIKHIQFFGNTERSGVFGFYMSQNYVNYVKPSPQGGSGCATITIDNSWGGIRTAFEERVKALGVNAQIFTGFP